MSSLCGVASACVVVVVSLLLLLLVGSHTVMSLVRRYMACQLKDTATVRALLRAPGVVDGVDHMRRDDGSTPLMVSCQVGAAHTVAELLRVGAAATRPNKEGVEPLHMAAQEGRADCIRHLTAHGCDPNRCLHEDFPPIFMAALGGHVDAVLALLEAGADVDQPVRRCSFLCRCSPH